MKSKRRIITLISFLLIIGIMTSACIARPAEDAQTNNANISSNQISESTKISYLGPEGTYTEEAAHSFFNVGTFNPKKTVNDAIADVKNNQADYAIIPQENTIGGAVNNYIDALIAENDVYVVGEVILPINQALMSVEGANLSDIKTICSHAQGIAQSEAWRKQNLPDATVREMDSTAAAAKYVAESNDKSIAAIAAPGAAKLYSLSVLAENVQITDTNKTRFYVLAPSKPDSKSGTYTNAVFTVSCTASKLGDIITDIQKNDAQLVTIHDRPSGTSLGTYNYIIEINSKSGISDKLISKLESHPDLKCKGIFNVIEK